MYLNGRLFNPRFRFASPWAKSLPPLRGLYIRNVHQWVTLYQWIVSKEFLIVNPELTDKLHVDHQLSAFVLFSLFFDFQQLDSLLPPWHLPFSSV